MKVSRSIIVPLVMLLGMLLLVAAVVATKEDIEETEESWGTWAKEKITEGLGLKNPLNEEEVGRKAGDTVKSTRESTQETVSGELCTYLLLLPYG